jgi:hypothetical protein
MNVLSEFRLRYPLNEYIVNHPVQRFELSDEPSDDESCD